MLLVKGCVSSIDYIYKESTKRQSSTTTKDIHKSREWGADGVDPVLRTSTGGIYKDPAYPNHYFDITTFCPICDGAGCSQCYNTGHQKVQIPTDGKLPKKVPLPADYYQHHSKVKQ